MEYHLSDQRKTGYRTLNYAAHHINFMLKKFGIYSFILIGLYKITELDIFKNE